MTTYGEKFSIDFQVSGDKARVAMIGAEGTEIFISLPLHNHEQYTTETLKLAVLNSTEYRLKGALLAIIATTWPRHDL